MLCLGLQFIFGIITGEHRQDCHIQLCEVLSDNPVASVLQRVSVEDWSELYGYYLMDMLKSVHHVPHHKPNEEYEVSHCVNVMCIVACAILMADMLCLVELK